METTVKVNGMTCQGCVRSVKRVLETIPGVQQADVSLEQKEARVSFAPAKPGVDAFKAAINDAGYEAA